LNRGKHREGKLSTKGGISSGGRLKKEFQKETYGGKRGKAK